jgi:alpha-glucosidase (family GH31 glycosyl hydrolase)
MRQLTTCHLECQAPAKDDLLAYPPYALRTGARGAKGAPKTLGTKTLPVSAQGVDGSRHYDTHNLYGLSQAAATHAALVKVLKRRPFLLSR